MNTDNGLFLKPGTAAHSETQSKFMRRLNTQRLRDLNQYIVTQYTYNTQGSIKISQKVGN